MIESSHTTVGGILCGLSVKIGAWHDKFGGREAGLIGQAEFIMSDMRQGTDLLLEISVPPVALPSAAGIGNGESDDEGVVLL